jgi:hypothetical protein
MPEVPRQQTDPELRQLAMQIASMLPEDSAGARKVLRGGRRTGDATEARHVLCLVTELMDNFLAAEEEAPTGPGG